MPSAHRCTVCQSLAQPGQHRPRPRGVRQLHLIAVLLGSILLGCIAPAHADIEPSDAALGEYLSKLLTDTEAFDVKELKFLAREAVAPKTALAWRYRFEAVITSKRLRYAGETTRQLLILGPNPVQSFLQSSRLARQLSSAESLSLHTEAGSGKLTYSTMRRLKFESCWR